MNCSEMDFLFKNFNYPSIMKKIFTVISLMAIGAVVFAQSPRMVLVEHFTQASCGPCASINPQVQPIIDANAHRTASIKYQTSWPGFDPMHEHNALDVNNRVAYYGVRAVPNSVMDGEGPGPSTTVISESNINSRTVNMSPFELNLNHSIAKRFGGVSIDLDITASQDYAGGDLVAHVVIVEKEIAFTSPPGSNGETVFHSVMKKMLPNGNGTDIKDSWVAGETLNLSLSWDFENVYRMDEISVVAFIQDNSGREIIQAAYTVPDLVAAGANDAVVTRATGYSNFDYDGICGSETSPMIEILNGGSSVLTSAKIYYSINGGMEQEYDWTGSLGFLGKQTVQLPAIGFSNQAVNSIDVRIESPNDGQDAQMSNNTIKRSFKAAPMTTTVSRVEVRQGPTANNLTWEIQNEKGDAIYSGGPYSSSFATDELDLDLDADECYQIVADNKATGLNGYIRLFNDADVELVDLTLETGGLYTKDFGTFAISSTDNLIEANTLKVYPNPTSTTTFVEFELLENAQMNFALINAIGQKVWNQTKQLNAGAQQEEINVSNLATGLYFLQMTTDGGQTTQQLIVE